ncbi:MAG TPA: hypothetical protein VNU46_06655 [Gemmatimonadaceae bacterium]|jgi:ketol-acid reductoisomerase|nr:hypothetical protein [Gemmatimonadaceae bacterium]
MPNIFYDSDADLSHLANRPIAILGFGSQGHAHALNLHESGCDVRVGLYPQAKSWTTVEAAGLRGVDVPQAVREARIVMMLTPDTGQGILYRDHIATYLAPGSTLMFAHGFNVRFGQIVPRPDLDVSMIAPKSPGHRVRVD